MEWNRDKMPIMNKERNGIRTKLMPKIHLHCYLSDSSFLGCDQVFLLSSISPMSRGR